MNRNHTSTDYENYASDGPGPIEIEARDKYTHRHIYNSRNNEESIRSHAGVGPKGYRRSDRAIEDEVCQMLLDDVNIDASSVSVDVENGVVKLFGAVHGRHDKFAIEDLIENVSGVKDIQNDLRIEQSRFYEY